MRILLLLGAMMPLMVCAQQLDSLHIMVDSKATDHTPYTYQTFQDASKHFIDPPRSLLD